MSSVDTIHLITTEAKAGRLCLSETEAAKCLGISGRTMFSLRAAGRIGFLKLGEGSKSRTLYPLTALEKFIAENLQVAMPGASGSVPHADQKPAADAGNKTVRITE